MGKEELGYIIISKSTSLSLFCEDQQECGTAYGYVRRLKEVSRHCAHILAPFCAPGERRGEGESGLGTVALLAVLPGTHGHID